MDTLEIEEIEQPVHTDTSNWFVADNFFKEHPENILGEAYQTSGRFGTVTKYKGDISAIDRIDVPMDFIGINRILNNPLLSTGEDLNIAAKMTKPDVADFVKKAITKADEQAGQKIGRKKNAIVEDDVLLVESPQLQTFEDVYRTYNVGMKPADLEVFIWYMTQLGKPLSRQWVNLLHPGRYTDNLTDTVSYDVEPEIILEWIKNGIAYYYAGNVVPAAQYLSGNMYDKKLQFTRDKEEIIEKYGQEIYQAQENAFGVAWRTIYEKRLTIGAGDTSLVILPISKLANNFRIDRIVEMPEDTPFKIKKVTANANKNVGKPDWAKEITLGEYDSSRSEFSELSLTEAFIFWMLRFRPELLQPITHYEIAQYYCLGTPIRLESYNLSQKEMEAKREKIKSATQAEGERLFTIFLDTQLEANDKIRLETQWNADYNNYLPIDFNKIPVAFNMCRYYKGAFEELKPEKREAVAFMMNNGSGVLSYDVGVGKTPSAIFSISAFMDAGYSRRPVICVPNQVYRQFISEIRNFAPHLPILEGYNLADEYLQNFKDVEGNITRVPDGVVTIITYEGLERIGFRDETSNELFSSLYEILNQGGEDEKAKSEKQKASFQQKLETLIGRGLAGTMVNIEDFGFDFMCYDEAHKMKKIFTSVKGEVTKSDSGKESRGRNPYVISSGTPSSIALKGFMLNYYIQTRNKGQNVMLLTATPFTNSPLEIFSMLTMVGYQQLKTTDLNNIKNFFDIYIKTSTELVINSRLKPQFKQVILGFNNLISLQTLIRRFINYKTGEDVNVQRPVKYVLPYLTKIENGIVTRLGEDEKIETYIQMTAEQEEMMNEIIAYVEGGNITMHEGATDSGDIDEDAITGGDAPEIDEDVLSEKEKTGVRIIKGLTWAKNLALSPHLYVNSGLPKPTYKTYIGKSPKLQYVMDCVKSVKKYHESHGEAVSGQVIYMDRGIEYFGLIKEYLVRVVGYAEHEVGIIVSGLPANGKRSKEYVKNLFNGEIYNENTQLFDSVSDEERVKIIIGSSTIKEGINLQKYGTVLYNCFVDWNPTDVQQLDGRIYRQGNTFNNIRTVMPLVVNSADIFIFQKLQEKTSRLNTIWATDGKANVLNTAEFNPEELKYALIRDVNVIAELKSIEAKSNLENEMMGYTRQKEIIEKIRADVAEINSHFGDVKEHITPYRDFKSTNDKLADAQTLVKITNEIDKSQRDKDGRKMVRSYERKPEKLNWESWDEFNKRKEKADNANYSPMDEFNKPYWFAEFAIAVRELVRLENEFIRQHNIPFSLSNQHGLAKFLNEIDDKVKRANENKVYFESDEFKHAIAKAEIERRETEKISYKTIQDNVIAFGRLNYLLSDKKVKISGSKKYGSCPPVSAGGERLIDSEALAYLDTCIANAGQIKDIYFDKVAGTYVPQRQELHNKIVAELFAGVRCVKKGAPIAVFTGGAPAAGKTTYLNKIANYLLTPDVFKLDADHIRELLPEYQGWNANTTHRETQDIVNELLDNIGDGSCRYDFVYDGTMNKAQKYFPLIKKVKELGYKTFIIFFDIPYGVARKRALERYKKSGRYVPVEVIDDFFKVIPDHNRLTMGQYALDQLKSVVDGYVVIDGITGQIISKGGEEMPKSRIYEDQARIEFKKSALKINTGGIDELSETTVEKSPEQDGQDILDTIAGLQILADDGDDEAKDTIEGLKLLLDV